MIAPFSPKQKSPEHRRDWYPYSAGFTEKFVHDVLRGPLASSTIVLDPWSGSGTTTATCVKQGIESVGLDINPALTVIAHARLTPRSIGDSLQPLAIEIVEAARELRVEWTENDLLRTWMRAPTFAHVRAIQAVIHRTLTPASDFPDPRHLARAADELPVLACFFYAALFATVRDLLSRFRSTNPTWLREPSSAHQRISPSWSVIEATFLSRVSYFRERLAVGDEARTSRFNSFSTQSAAHLSFEPASFDGALTSPPYATRIDYVRGVLPELCVLGANADSIKSLRKVSTGSPVVRGVHADPGPLHSRYGRQVLAKIRTHSSKGSAAYYLPWMSNYLLGLQAGLFSLARAVKPHSPICVVVQDSHYKEMHVDLQRIVVEIMDATDRGLLARYDYAATALRSRMNPRARIHLPIRHNSESLLILR